jgi:hypothetical protein
LDVFELADIAASEWLALGRKLAAEAAAIDCRNRRREIEDTETKRPSGVLRDSLRRGTQKVEEMESYTDEENKEGSTCLETSTSDSPLL